MRTEEYVERAHRGDERERRIRRALHDPVQTAYVLVRIGQGTRGLRYEVRSPERIHSGSDAVAEGLQERAKRILHPPRWVKVEAWDGYLDLRHNWISGSERNTWRFDQENHHSEHHRPESEVRGQ